MNITLRQLRAFTEVARRESFTEAAKQLHLSQSAVSALIRELERQIGFGLLDRTTRRVVLSASGGHLLELSERGTSGRGFGALGSEEPARQESRTGHCRGFATFRGHHLARHDFPVCPNLPQGAH